MFRIKISLDHPVDMYAIMDLTGSMSTHKKNLGKAAEAIADALKDKTADYRLGYGSFRDKPRPPFGAGNNVSLNNDHSVQMLELLEFCY